MQEPLDSRLYVLGGFRLEHQGREIRFARRKVASLLAYLALHPARHSRDELAALFWGDFLDRDARASLRTSLSPLRQALGDDLLIADNQSVQINRTFPLWVDARAFEEYARQFLAEPPFDLSLGFIDLYQGELLPDFYDDWIAPARERLHGLYVDVLLHAAQQMRAHSEYARAIELAARVLSSEPGNERAHQHIMFCHMASGDRAAALRQFETCRQALRADLDVEPSPETVDLFDWIRGRPEHERSRAARRTNLPIPLTSFIGRAEQMTQVKRMLSAQRLVTVTGPGGCGKSRLTIQVAADLVDSFADGVWFVDLSGVQAEALVVQAIANALGAQPLAGEATEETLCAFLRARRLLLVLDNCEHVIAACAHLAESVLAGALEATILATSREPLGVSGEALYVVPPLSAPPADAIPPVLAALASFESTQLFIERATTLAPLAALGDADAPAVATICRQLDGMPLAIELAAARVRVLNVREIAERLGERFRLLTSSGRGGPARQRSLQDTIDWSYRLLTPDDQALLRRLSVFVGGFSLAGATAVCGEGCAEGDMLERLARLIDRSLVIAEQREGVTRYRMLETIRQFAWERLEEAGERDATVRRFVAYYPPFCQATLPGVFTGERDAFRTAIHRFDLEHDNLRAAITWSAQTGQHVEAVWLIGLHDYWTWRGEDFSEFDAYMSSCPPLPPTTPWVDRSRYHACRVDCARHRGDLHAAYLAAKEWQDAAVSAGVTDELGIGWVCMGKMAALASHFEEAEYCLRQAMEYPLSASQHITYAIAAAELPLRRGQWDRAWQAFESALAACRSQPELGIALWGAGAATTGLAQAAYGLGDSELAQRLAREAVVWFRDMEHRGGLWLAFAVLAVARASLGQIEHAASLWGATRGGPRSHRPVGITGAMAVESEATMARARDQLGEARYEELLAQGRAMTMEQAARYALEEG